jgi:hypothetical protein
MLVEALLDEILPSLDTPLRRSTGARQRELIAAGDTARHTVVDDSEAQPPDAAAGDERVAYFWNALGAKLSTEEHVALARIHLRRQGETPRSSRMGSRRSSIVWSARSHPR